MRLDRYLSSATGLSRSEVQRLLKAALVQVNGDTVTTGRLHITDNTVVAVDGQTVMLPSPTYLMLHKPAGYVSANTDADHPTVLDLLGAESVRQHRRDPLQIAGRLDVDTTGLVLITTDGQWNHRITSPSGACAKTYLVSLAEVIDPEQVKTLEQGVQLRSEKKPSKPCSIVPVSDTQLRITLNEGKYHQVKRMFAAVGNRVKALHRERVGAIVLDSALAPGDFRNLTPEEIASV